MEDFYNILAKHFSKETKPDEEQLVSEFEEKNSVEYHALKKIWNANEGDIFVTDFDANEAFKKVKNQVDLKNKHKVIPLFSTALKIAASIVLVIATSLVGYVTYNNAFGSNVIVAQNNSNETLELKLKDGTIVWLNSGATLTYKKQFSEDKRETELNGEAFFDVTKDKSRPFFIKTNNTIVTVLGTSFNVKNDNTQTEIAVKTGMVNVESSKTNESIIVKPGFSAIVNSDKLESYKTNNHNYFSWKTGVFIFEATPLKQVIHDLKSFYKDKLPISENLKNNNCNLTAKFENTPISQVIETIELSCSIKINKDL